MSAREDTSTDPRTGVWLFGALGSIATHVIVGAHALSRGLIDTTGLVTELEPFPALSLPPFSSLVFGGHELREGSPLEAAEEICEASGSLRPGLISELKEELERLSADIRPGCRSGLGEWAVSLAGNGDQPPPVPAAEVERMATDMREFRQRHQLSRVIAVNLGSTEPVDPSLLEQAAGRSLDELLASEHAGLLPGSCLFVAAAIKAGCSVVNFTPSPAFEIEGIRAAADAAGVSYCGKDGKTGETLLKSVLGPMFLWRHLRVLSWESYNLLGNRDGQVLSYPGNKASKIQGKADVLRSLYDYPFHSSVHIDYVPSLDDWKTAWNFIHFEGFLGNRMTLQFTWQGCDSALAAPLVLDLVRLVAFACERGESGPMEHLAAFFKAPFGDVPTGLEAQMDLLAEYVRAHAPAGSR